MTPIHQLLSRISYDPEFGSGQFQIGYLDRIEGTIHRVAMCQITFPEDQRRVFELRDEYGQVQRIPFHRVREVFRDGDLIWSRPPSAGEG